MNKKINLLSCAIVSLAISEVYETHAQEVLPVETKTATTPMEVIKQGLDNGKFNLDARLRYEYADIGDLNEAHAFTIAARIGYTTGPIYGFKAMLEGEHTSSILQDSNYSAPGQVVPGKSVIADPEGSEINRAWLSYDLADTEFKLGRQRVVLDNSRFIGNVIWRQAEQTYDAIGFTNKSIEDLSIYYAYFSQINRITYTSWDSDSHIINLNYKGLPGMQIGAYSYLLQFDSSLANSSDTYGVFIDGSLPSMDELKLKYRGEFAYQTDGRDSPLDYQANYYHLSLSGAYKNFSAGGGYEVLESDGGMNAFRTPLALLHGFNGWADSFLATPNDGLTDAYAFLGYKFGKVPFKVIYHDFSAETGGNDYGYEIDAIASYKFHENWTALVKYAYHDNASNRPDVERFWFQFDFHY